MEHSAGEAAATLPYTILLHFSSRLLTFVLNSVLIRLVAHDVLGLANVRLQLLFSTVVFIAREPFRRALPAGEQLPQRSEKKLSSRNWAIVRTNFLCPILAAVVGLPLTLVWVYLLEEPPEKFSQTYTLSTLLYGMAALAETLGEPAVAANHLASDFKLRIKAEGLAVGIRTFLTVFLVLIWAPAEGKPNDCIGCELYGFALAQFVSSVAYSAWLWLKAIPIIKLSHVSSKYDSLFEPTYLRLSGSFLAHSVVKQLLTEGERYVMTVTGLMTLAEQGVYDVINNLGSLVARLVFLPLEDCAYLVFTQMLNREHKSNISDLPSKPAVLITRTLSTSLKASLLVGCGCAVFGWFYSDIVLITYAGRSFVEGSEAIQLLQWFCLYTVFLAGNGITESFAMAGMSQNDLDWHNLYDIIIWVIYCIATVGLATYFGSIGFIYANCFNMFCRIGLSIHWIDHFYDKSNFSPLMSSLPSPYVIVSLIVLGMFASCLNSIFPTILYRFIHGGILGIVALVVYFIVERKDLRYIYELVAKKRREDD